MDQVLQAVDAGLSHCLVLQELRSQVLLLVLDVAASFLEEPHLRVHRVHRELDPLAPIDQELPLGLVGTEPIPG